MFLRSINFAICKKHFVDDFKFKYFYFSLRRYRILSCEYRYVSKCILEYECHYASTGTSTTIQVLYKYKYSLTSTKQGAPNSKFKQGFFSAFLLHTTMDLIALITNITSVFLNRSYFGDEICKTKITLDFALDTLVFKVMIMFFLSSKIWFCNYFFRIPHVKYTLNMQLPEFSNFGKVTEQIARD